MPTRLAHVAQVLLEMVGLEGLASHHVKKVNALAKHKRRWRIWMETHYLTCTHPAVVGSSEHMLLIGKKGGNEILYRALQGD